MFLTFVYAFLSVAIVSLVSLVGVIVLTVRTDVVSRVLLYLVSFSTGAILGTVFFHLLPEVMEHAGDPVMGSAWILGGMMLAFVIEKFIHWHHCHRTEHDDAGGHHNHPLGALILIGDGIHNFLDGTLIAAAYMVSVPVGIAATVAVVLHEIPQELSDISLLLHSGFSRNKAILWNFLSACTAIVGAGAAFFFGTHMHGIEFVLLPIAAGNFLYIATTDLIPELHKETRVGKNVVQGLLLLAGIGLMAWLSLAANHEDVERAIDEHQDATSSNGGILQMRVLDADGNPVDDSVRVNVRTR